MMLAGHIDQRATAVPSPKPKSATRKPLLVVDPNFHDFLYCARCHGDIGWPKSASAQDKKELADARRRNDWTAGNKIAHERLGLGPREAKALYLHITGGPGICHRTRCKAALSGEVSCCPNCQSVNLDW